MPDFKSLRKNGWHPKHDLDFKNPKKSVKGLLGRGEDDEREARVAVPISSLRDPSTFAPPPKRTNTFASPPPPAGAGYQSPTSTGGYTTQQPSYGQPSAYTQQQQQSEADEPPPPPKPYVVNTTGLSTNNLPPPPVRRLGTGTGTSTPSPPPPARPSLPTPSASQSRPGPPPSLPPRLPPRNNTPTLPSSTPQPPAPTVRSPTQEPSYLNQSSINRLGSHGLSVPGFNIGSPSPSPSSLKPVSSPQPQSLPSTPGEGRGTTWAQKQAALRTASNLHRNPSSVSTSDALSAASTVQNFHSRHGEQMNQAAGGVADRFGKMSVQENSTPSTPRAGMTVEAASGSMTSLVAGKKKPPPPPVGKKPSLVAGRVVASRGAEEDGGFAPPPVPLGTRPRF